MKKFIFHKENKYDASKITFIAYKKLFPNKTASDFKTETGRNAEKSVKKSVEKPVKKNEN